MEFLDHHVAPCLGPVPTEPHSSYSTPAAFVGTLFEPSLNFSTKGPTTVRFSIDITALADRQSIDAFGELRARDTLHQWASVLESDTKWLEHFLSRFSLLLEETEILRTKIPLHIYHPPACSIGCELSESSRSLKAYLPVKRKSLATGKSPSSIILDALRSLPPLGEDYDVGGVDVLAS